MAPLEYLKVLRRRWRVVVACVLLAAGIGYVVSPGADASASQGPTYQATLTMIQPPGGEVNLHLAARLAVSPDVAQMAGEALGEPPLLPNAGEDGSAPVTADVDTDAKTMSVTATADSEPQAVELVQAYSNATIAFLQQAATQTRESAIAAAQAEVGLLERTIADLQDQLEDDPSNEVLDARLEAEVTRYGVAFGRLQELTSGGEGTPPLAVLGAAQVVELDSSGFTAPSDPRVRALLAGVVGLLLGIIAVMVIDRADTRLRGRDEVEEAFGLPVLAEIPRLRRRDRRGHCVVVVDRPLSPGAEAYRSLRSALTLVTQHRGAVRGRAPSRRARIDTPRVIVVTGGRGGDGKSTTTVNLAAAIAETGRTVLVIDCDFRKPDVNAYLDPAPGVGLADLANSDLYGSLDLVMRPTSITGVSLVSSDRPVAHPTDVIALLPKIVNESRDRVDLVLLDSSPLLATSDAVDVLQVADAAVVSCRSGRTTFEMATRTRRLLERADIPALGLVLTGSEAHRGTQYGQPSWRERMTTRLTSWWRPSQPPEWPRPPSTVSVDPVDEDPVAARPETAGTRLDADASEFGGFTWADVDTSTPRRSAGSDAG